MIQTILCLLVGSPSDEQMSARLSSLTGEVFSAVVKSGERATGRVVSVERRVGRRRGVVAQYRIELEAVNSTPEFFNRGDPTKASCSQN